MHYKNIKDLGFSPILVIVGLAIAVTVTTVIVDMTPFRKIDPNKNGATTDRTSLYEPSSNAAIFNPQTITPSSSSAAPSLQSASTPSHSATPTPAPARKSVLDYIKERLGLTPSPTPTPTPSSKPTPTSTPKPSNTPSVPTLSLSPSSGVYNKGCSFVAEVNLSTAGQTTDGTDMVLFFDPDYININSITAGNLYPEYLDNEVDNSAGIANLSGLGSVSNSFNGSGKFATISFQILGFAPFGDTQVKFEFNPNDKSSTTDSNIIKKDGGDILDAVVNATYTVGSGLCN